MNSKTGGIPKTYRTGVAGLVVTKALRSYTLVHAASGLTVKSGFWTIKDAKGFAARIEGFADWTLSYDALLPDLPDIGRKVMAVLVGMRAESS